MPMSALRRTELGCKLKADQDSPPHVDIRW
jgi:hypothetical protein